jgi:ribulose-5-phosphate 4-epimerase/fuculose-1-phosphate aldolase
VTTQDSCLFYDNQAVYENFGGIVLAAQEGVNIAKALGPKNKCAVLQNHGLLTLGSTVDECAYLFAALDRQCHAQLMIEAASKPGLEKSVIDDVDAEFTANTIQ